MPAQKSVGCVSKHKVTSAVVTRPAIASEAAALGERSRNASSNNRTMAQTVIRITGER